MHVNKHIPTISSTYSLKDKFVDLVLSFHLYVGSEDQTQVVRHI